MTALGNIILISEKVDEYLLPELAIARILPICLGLVPQEVLANTFIYTIMDYVVQELRHVPFLCLLLFLEADQVTGWVEISWNVVQGPPTQYRDWDIDGDTFSHLYVVSGFVNMAIICLLTYRA